MTPNKESACVSSGALGGALERAGLEMPEKGKGDLGRKTLIFLALLVGKLAD